jgi:hypothetical protein
LKAAAALKAETSALEITSTLKANLCLQIGLGEKERSQNNCCQAKVCVIAKHGSLVSAARFRGWNHLRLVIVPGARKSSSGGLLCKKRTRGENLRIRAEKD